MTDSDDNNNNFHSVMCGNRCVYLILSCFYHMGS